MSDYIAIAKHLADHAAQLATRKVEPADIDAIKAAYAAKIAKLEAERDAKLAKLGDNTQVVKWQTAASAVRAAMKGATFDGEKMVYPKGIEQAVAAALAPLAANEDTILHIKPGKSASTGSKGRPTGLITPERQAYNRYNAADRAARKAESDKSDTADALRQKANTLKAAWEAAKAAEKPVA